MDRIILLTTLHKTKTSLRAREYEKCLSINCSNPSIGAIVIFLEGDAAELMNDFPSLNNEKITTVHVAKRPSYKDFFDYADTHFSEEFIIVSNADIYFDLDSCIERAKEVQDSVLWSLCRYNYSEKTGQWALQGGGKQGSYDSWAYKAPLNLQDSDLMVGIEGCDSYICQKAVEGGLSVSNPSLSIFSKHEHHDMGERNRYLQNDKKVSYKHKPDYMKARYRSYCPSSSYIEENDYLSNSSLMYKFYSMPLAVLFIKLARKLNLSSSK